MTITTNTNARSDGNNDLLGNRRMTGTENESDTTSRFPPKWRHRRIWDNLADKPEVVTLHDGHVLASVTYNPRSGCVGVDDSSDTEGLSWVRSRGESRTPGRQNKKPYFSAPSGIRNTWGASIVPSWGGRPFLGRLCDGRPGRFALSSLPHLSIPTYSAFVCRGGPLEFCPKSCRAYQLPGSSSQYRIRSLACDGWQWRITCPSVCLSIPSIHPPVIHHHHSSSSLIHQQRILHLPFTCFLYSLSLIYF